jgi:hypothetical protein
MMTDTDRKAEDARLRALRAMSPERRLSLAVGWSKSVREMTRSGLRQQFPQLNEREMLRLLAVRWLGEDLAMKVYGPIDAHG